MHTWAITIQPISEPSRINTQLPNFKSPVYQDLSTQHDWPVYKSHWSKFCIFEDLVVSYTSKVEIPVSRYLSLILRGIFNCFWVLGLRFLPTLTSSGQTMPRLIRAPASVLLFLA